MTTIPDLAEIDLDTQPPPRLRMSEAEFDAFVHQCDENVGLEWVDGEVIMTPPASAKHVALAGLILQLLGIFARQRNAGTVLGPELQIRHPSMRRRRVPDVLFVSNARLNIIKEMWIEGAPDLIVEIVSKDSVARDWREKYLEYEAAGVREYWIVDPLSRRVEAYALEPDGHYRTIEPSQGIIRSTVLACFYLNPDWLWQEPLPNPLEILKELGVV